MARKSTVTHLLPLVLYSALISSKAWEALRLKDDLWRPFLSTVDPMSALGEKNLEAMPCR